MKGLWLPNVKKFISGSNPSGTIYAADVRVRNLATDPVYVAQVTALQLKEFRYQDFSKTQLPAKTDAFVQIGDTDFGSADIAYSIAGMKVSNNSGDALVIAKGADAAAAASQANWLAVINQGQTSLADFALNLVAGDKIWVRGMSNTAATVDGILIVNLLG